MHMIYEGESSGVGYSLHRTLRLKKKKTSAMAPAGTTSSMSIVSSTWKKLSGKGQLTWRDICLGRAREVSQRQILIPQDQQGRVCKGNDDERRG